MSEQYTPTTEDVEFYYAGPDLDSAERSAAFYRWLYQERFNAIKTMGERWDEAKADAWDEGHSAGVINEHEFRPGKQITNPHREATDD